MNSPRLRVLWYIFAALLAALLTLVWGMIFWANPLPYSVLKRVPDNYTAGSALLEHFPESGTYLFPDFHDFDDNLDPLRKGPLAMLHLNREGEPKPLKTLLSRGFLLNWVSTTVLVLILALLPSLPASYFKRTLLLTVFGVVSAVFSHGADIIWWFHPVDWHLVVLLYTAVSWLITGLILAIDPEKLWQALREKQQRKALPVARS